MHRWEALMRKAGLPEGVFDMSPTALRELDLQQLSAIPAQTKAFIRRIRKAYLAFFDE